MGLAGDQRGAIRAASSRLLDARDLGARQHPPRQIVGGRVQVAPVRGQRQPLSPHAQLFVAVRDERVGSQLPAVQLRDHLIEHAPNL